MIQYVANRKIDAKPMDSSGADRFDDLLGEVERTYNIIKEEDQTELDNLEIQTIPSLKKDIKSIQADIDMAESLNQDLDQKVVKMKRDGPVTDDDGLYEHTRDDN